MTRNCNNCGAEYETGNFGAGPRYCSRKCCHTMKGPLHPGNRYRGRPRRFPKPNTAMTMVILDFLRSKGVHKIEPYNCNETGNRFVIKQRWLTARLTIGGGYKDEGWAHICAFLAEDGKPVLASTCRNLRPSLTPIKDIKDKFLPCMKRECPKCFRTGWLLEMLELDKEEKRA